MSFPRFQYHLTSASNPMYGYITLDGNKVHRIKDAREFHRALGYTNEIMKSGLLPEEFIWFEYHKNNSEKAEVCLQGKIIEYLLKHSENFKNEYANEVQHWFGSCVDKKFGQFTECIDCIMHPKRMRN